MILHFHEHSNYPQIVFYRYLYNCSVPTDTETRQEKYHHLIDEFNRVKYGRLDYV